MAMKETKFKFNRLTLASAVALTTATIGLTVSAVNSQSPATIKVDGSSTVFPITEVAAEEFQKSKGGKVRVTVGVSGTGGGFQKFCRGEIDIADASRPIKDSEIAACKQAGISFMELPVAYDALTVVVNKGNNWAKNLTTAELKKIWAPGSQVKNWNQVRSGFPNAPIKLFGPGANSGTFEYFTEAIVGKSKASRSDYTASEDDNVLVTGVSRDKNALGYFGYAYFEENKGKLNAVGINNGKATVMPSPQAVQNGTYTPLSRPLFIYVSSKSANKPEVRDFVNFYLSNGARLARQAKYVALPAQAYTIASGHFKNKKMGTVFGGDIPVGLRIEELLRREARQ